VLNTGRDWVDCDCLRYAAEMQQRRLLLTDPATSRQVCDALPGSLPAQQELLDVRRKSQASGTPSLSLSLCVCVCVWQRCLSVGSD
jgi:hypothetical protein